MAVIARYSRIHLGGESHINVRMGSLGAERRERYRSLERLFVTAKADCLERTDPRVELVQKLDF